MKPPTQLVFCADGPVLVRGDFELVSSTGEALARRRTTVALCRCGASAIKPFCDGTHKILNSHPETAGAGGAQRGAAAKPAEDPGAGEPKPPGPQGG